MKDKIAILFKIIPCEEEELFLLYPSNIIVGSLDEKGATITDKNTSEFYLNTDLAIKMGLENGMNLIVSPFQLKKYYKTLTLSEATKKFWIDMTKKAYFYDLVDEDFTLHTLSKQDFYELYRVNYDDFNDLPNKGVLLSVLKGEITIDEMFEKLGWNEEDNNDEIKEKIQKEVDYSEIPISNVINKVKESIVSQDEPIKRLVTAIYKNIIFDDPKAKSNILLYGPTGVGKTEIVKTLAKFFGLPIVIEDMTRFTDAGYKGASIDDILRDLYFNANEDINLAQKAIVVLDEIDKKAGGESEKSFNKEDVLKSLLSLIEGGTFEVETSERGETISFDTSQLTVIAMGAFSDLLQPIKKTNSIGFSNTNEKKDTTKEITVEDFIKYGLPVEFLGRFKSIIKMNSLSLKDLEKILKESDLSSLKILKQKFKDKLNIDLNISDEIIGKIALKAYERKTGARALNVIVDEMFEEILYQAFNNPKAIDTVSINKDTFENKHNFTMIKRIKTHENE